MNPVLIVVLVLIAVLCAVGSYVGRKQSEWKNLVRIVVGVGAFVGLFRLILCSSSTWVILGSLFTICVGLLIANLCKECKMGPAALLRLLLGRRSHRSL